jgi:hypothetical protein
LPLLTSSYAPWPEFHFVLEIESRIGKDAVTDILGERRILFVIYASTWHIHYGYITHSVIIK